MRKIAIASVSTIAVVASMLLIASTTGAVGGTGVYGTWTTSSVTFPGTYYPAASVTSDASLSTQTGGGTWLGTNTPMGATYGSSRDHMYLTNQAGTVSNPKTTTITFDTAPTAGTWSFALGDVDAENVHVEATDVNGAALSTAGWYQSSFNYCNVSPKPSNCPPGSHTDQPTWNASTSTLHGNGTNTSGAAGWLTPTGAVKTLTFVSSVITGFPEYQIWIAADVMATPTATPTASPTNGPTPSPTPTPTPSPTDSREPQTGQIEVEQEGNTIVIPPITTSTGEIAHVRVRCTSVSQLMWAGDVKLCNIKHVLAAVRVHTKPPVKVTIIATAPGDVAHQKFRKVKSVVVR